MQTTLLEQEPMIFMQDTPPQAFPAATRSITLAFLIGCVTLMMTGFAIIMPVFPQRLHALGQGAETLALMEGAFGLGMFLFSTPLGALAGKIGRKPILLLSLVGYILTNLLLVAVNTPLLFVLIRFREGLVISGLMPASMAMVGDTVAPEKQGRWIGWLTTAQATGIALGPAIGGVLVQTLGFTAPFLLSAVIALLASLLALFLLPETLPKQERTEVRSRSHKSEARPVQTFQVLAFATSWHPFPCSDECAFSCAYQTLKRGPIEKGRHGIHGLAKRPSGCLGVTESKQTTALPDCFRFLIVILHQRSEGFHECFSQIVDKNQRFVLTGPLMGHQILLIHSFLATRDILRIRKPIAGEPSPRDLHRGLVSAGYISEGVALGYFLHRGESTGDRHPQVLD